MVTWPDLGGCAVINYLYDELIKQPWLKMKRTHFGGTEVALHGFNSYRYSVEQKSGLCQLFKHNNFFRFSHMMSREVELPEGYEPYNFAAAGLLKCIEKSTQLYSIDSIAIIFEESHRGDKFIPRYFSPYECLKDDGGVVPMEWCLMPKSSIEPGLEVADFVIHSAGAETLARINGNTNPRKDVDCIFYSVDSSLSRHVEIIKAKLRVE